MLLLPGGIASLGTKLKGLVAEAVGSQPSVDGDVHGPSAEAVA
jgi:hypothetical protein